MRHITSLYGRHVTTPQGELLSARATIYGYRVLDALDSAPRTTRVRPGYVVVVGYCGDALRGRTLLVEQEVPLGADGLPQLGWDWVAPNV